MSDHHHDEDQAPDEASRRRFLTLMGASMAMASTACTKQPKETIVPYVRQPEHVIPGKPLFFATAMCQAGLATGVLVESHLGRPTKIEGNPDHPASLGATNAFMQASVLSLYDPDRSTTITRNGAISTWGAFLQAKPANVRILTGTVTSPTLAAQLQDLSHARWHQWEPCGRHAARAGSLAAFGSYWNTLYNFDRAERILSLDADFLEPSMPGHLRYANDFAISRRKGHRLYMAESSPSITGGMADHRFRMRACDVEAFAFSLWNGEQAAILRDLEQHRSSSIVIAGEFQSATVHALAHALNARLDNVGSTVLYTDPIEASPVDEVASLADLVRDMRAGAVDALLILGGNPVYDAPADLGFADALKNVKWTAHLGQYANETAAHCVWHIPEAHYLEAWSDARAWDGSASIIQPLIEPLYQGRSAHDVLNAFNSEPLRTARQTVQDYWKTQHPGADFDDFWRTSLHNGIVANTSKSIKRPPAPQVPQPSTHEARGLEITFRPDPTIGDGVFSNNAWLQELPKPVNKMTWDNAVWISPATAQRLKLAAGDNVELTSGPNKIQAPCLIQPGQADESLAIHFGYGRTHSGRVSDGVGFNAYALRLSTALSHQTSGIGISLVSKGYQFAHTQHMETMAGRDPVRMGVPAKPPEQPSLFPIWPYPKHKWGMSIDLNACTGCNACMVACQSENNIAVVGKAQVALGRHMNWLRIDRYFEGPDENPRMYFQPVPCMHCEEAPCELVCPVAATVHSEEGLNEMVYNRCVGTRYCSNNCPYKVRRFNFFLYSDWQTESLKGVRNPDVTVRSRGVMEKCTYCVQRIERVKIDAQEQGDRPLRPDEIVTACQQACPTRAITFGDLNNPASAVARQKQSPRSYALLEELGTKPRTTYLTRLRNPNPELEPHA